MQVTYDKLVTTNVFSKHFGECRDGKMELGQDTTLTIRGEATRYQVCHGTLRDSSAYGCSGCLPAASPLQKEGKGVSLSVMPGHRCCTHCEYVMGGAVKLRPPSPPP